MNTVFFRLHAREPNVYAASRDGGEKPACARVKRAQRRFVGPPQLYFLLARRLIVKRAPSPVLAASRRPLMLFSTIIFDM